MLNLTRDFERLAAEITTAREARMELNGKNRQQARRRAEEVSLRIAQFGEERADAQQDLRIRCVEALDQIHDRVEEIRQELVENLGTERERRVRQTDEDRQERRRFLEDLRADVDKKNAQSRVRREKNREEQRRQAAQSRKERADFAAHLSRSAADFAQESAERSAEIRAELARSARSAQESRRQFVADLNRSSQAFREEARAAHHQAAESSRQGRREALSSLHESVGALRGDIREDLALVRQVWSGGARLLSSLDISTGAPGLAKAAKGPAPGSAQPGNSDDLTRIPGIGAGLARRLKESGIHTFRDLAACRVEALRDKLGRVGGLVNVEEILHEAARHAEGR